MSRTPRLLAAAAALLVLAVPNPAAAAPTPLPAHVYAPYFETWQPGTITGIAQQSGARHFTLAFLETLSKTSCILAWNGESARTVATDTYVDDIAALRALGGDAVPSFGGWSADQNGTEIGDSCQDPAVIAAAYEDVVTRLGVTRLDMDIEGRSLTKPDGIDRRNKALKLMQDWAAATGRRVDVVYTLPTSAAGLEPSGLAVLQNAVANGVRVDIVNIMVFDYYDKVTTDMGAAALTAAQGLYGQLHTLYPAKSPAQLWAMIGMTMLPGIDDYPKKTEITYLPDAQRMLDFARANGLSLLSAWAIQRDNGGCPGQTDSNTCSGIVQNTWDFTHLLTPFTG
ncbi:chitinase [Catellatospora tritici]|uniref:chitinase n=1 Tax=Catellatospora tritici TaxID=2851566 RepID=UPI001C2CD7DF|nr:chitinase [Catellatospora tritici]MBV1854456.1 chitinase [Catellatospora tritici]